MNFLVTGADNSTDKSCVDLQDKGARSGERSDTIMVIRLDPATKRSAVLSFPRDLWVKIPGHGTQRINGAYRRDDPPLLIDTIKQEFDLNIDHFIQIDFCAFQRLVKAHRRRQRAAAVPRARRLDRVVEQPSIRLPQLRWGRGIEVRAFATFRIPGRGGQWHEDPSSDLGRIARQQDFLRRTLTAALKQNVLKPKIITSLYASYRDDLVIDTGMTIDKMIEFVGVVRKVTASEIRTYQIEATGKKISGNSVLVWHKDSENMQAILNIFRGIAPLADAPEQGSRTPPRPRRLPRDVTTTVKSSVRRLTLSPSTGTDVTGTTVDGGDRPHCRTLRRRRSCPTQPSSAERSTGQRSSTVANASAARRRAGNRGEPGTAFRAQA